MNKRNPKKGDRVVNDNGDMATVIAITLGEYGPGDAGVTFRFDSDRNDGLIEGNRVISLNGFHQHLKIVKSGLDIILETIE